MPTQRSGKAEIPDKLSQTHQEPPHVPNFDRSFQLFRCISLFLSLIVAHTVSLASEPLKYIPAAVDNPLKGLVPYSGDKRDNFPHSMEFNYLPLSGLMTGMKTFNWTPLEELLDDVASRRHQAVVRIWMVYPGRNDGIPSFLVEDGVKVTTWLNSNTQPFPPAKVHTPDYDDPRMRQALRNFIVALGSRYDGDPRLGFLTAGLLGTWGEWHEYPRTDLFASKETQAEVMTVFSAAFKKTPVLLRYPSGKDHWCYASNSDRPFGYHDDSFAWATLDTGRKEDGWFFVPSLQEAGSGAVEKWKHHPIGGEIRPELWGNIFDNNPSHEQAQDFAECVKQTHASWLLDTGMMEKRQTPERIANASRSVQKMGYEFYVPQATVVRQAARLAVNVWVRNTGVAPFYYDWDVELAALDGQGKVLKKWPADWHITRLLPGDEDRSWSTAIDASSLPAGTKWMGVRVANPQPNGLPLRFANAPDRQQADGWLRVGTVP